jgi:hypothetical protein
MAAPAIADLDLPGYKALHVGGAYAYPVPFKPASGHTVITFKNLDVGSTIKVFTIMGEKVVELKSSGVSSTQWDLRNQDGDQVASGVYVYQIKSGDSENRGKLMVIR